jgi:hypothetical protein
VLYPVAVTLGAVRHRVHRNVHRHFTAGAAENLAHAVVQPEEGGGHIKTRFSASQGLSSC